MAEILIMKEQVVEGFLEDGAQCPVLKLLISSSTYIVNWDGQEYICEAYEAPSEYYPSGTCILGNEKYMNALISGSQAEIVEPFMIFIYPDDEYIDYNGFATFMCMDEGCTSDSHIIAIYEVEESNGVVIKDPLGRSITYGEYDKILLNRANGEKTIYSMGEAIDNVNVELDFSSGDMNVDGGEDKLMKSVTIEKPETLLPENIVSGVTIAGIDGEAIGNGEEKTVELDFTNGNQEIFPDDGCLLSKVIVEKPDTLVPANIAEGVNIAGIIGIFAGAGGVGSNNVYIKEVTVWSKASGKNSGILTLVTAEELASIRFDTTKPQFVGIFPGSSSNSAYGYISNSGTGTLISGFACNFLLCAAYSGNSYGFYYKGYTSSSRVQKATCEVTTNPFSGNALTNFPYYLNGEIVYDVDNSTMELCNRSTKTGSRKIYVVVGNIIPTV